jgi:hypothetical protein
MWEHWVMVKPAKTACHALPIFSSDMGLKAWTVTAWPSIPQQQHQWIPLCSSNCFVSSCIHVYSCQNVHYILHKVYVTLCEGREKLQSKQTSKQRHCVQLQPNLGRHKKNEWQPCVIHKVLDHNTISCQWPAAKSLCRSSLTKNQIKLSSIC